MKKELIIILLIVILFVIGYFCYNKFWINTTEDNEEKIKTVSGIVYDTSMNVLTIKDSNGLIYTFSIENVDRSNIENILIGNLINIEYEGSLSNTADIQNVKIDKITIEEVDNQVPNAWNDHGIFSEYYTKAYDLLQNMTLEEKIGQLFLVRVPENSQIEAIKEYHFGGYILFGRDTKNETKESLKNKIQSYQDNSKIPMIIAVDEEGGTVVRISSNPNLRSEKFPSPQELYQEGGYDKITSTTIEMSELLSSLGINVNLAPVADVSTDPNDFIYKRSFGKDALETSKFIETVITTSKNYDVSYVLKHFPGYGNNKDTHTGISIDERPLEQFEKVDFLPFETGIKEGAEAVLFSHNIINQVEANTPASLSLTMHNILRGELEFTGITMTDDLDMDAIKNYIEGSSVVKAILAGNDIIILSDYKQAYNEVISALNDGTLTEELIDHNVFRILAWKYYKGLL